MTLRVLEYRTEEECILCRLMYKCNKREAKKGEGVTKECKYIYKEEEVDEGNDDKMVSVECSL